MHKELFAKNFQELEGSRLLYPHSVLVLVMSFSFCPSQIS